MLACATPSSHRRDADVYLMPIGQVPADLVQSLTLYCAQTFHIVCAAAPEIPIDPRYIDRKRKQIVVEDLLVTARAAAPLLSDSSASLVIGLTAADIYTEDMNWRFALSAREGYRSTVISYARMDNADYGLPVDHELLKARIRKMIAKTIGLQVFRLEVNDNPQSVLYGSILGVPDLDAIDESTVPSDVLIPAGEAGR
jgi:predicted Zn-dependent protease